MYGVLGTCPPEILGFQPLRQVFFGYLLNQELSTQCILARRSFRDSATHRVSDKLIFTSLQYLLTASPVQCIVQVAACIIILTGKVLATFWSVNSLTALFRPFCIANLLHVLKFSCLTREKMIWEQDKCSRKFQLHLCTGTCVQCSGSTLFFLL